MEKFDCIVIGIGAMGAAACSFLAARGIQVLGLEQFQIPHEHGSHGGQSRIIRKAYFEHANYVPLLERAYHNWRSLENETGESLYHQTGIVYFGPPNHPTMEGIRRSALQHSIDLKMLSTPFPNPLSPFKIPDTFQSLLEPEAGFLVPEKIILLYCEHASKNGAVIRQNEKTLSWRKSGDLYVVATDKNEYNSKKLIFTAGSWTRKLIPSLPVSLKVTQQLLAWATPKSIDKFMLGNFPCWFVEDPDRGMFYGFPSLPENGFEGPPGLKLASHRPGRTIDPDQRERHNHFDDEDDIRFFLSTYLPDADAEINATKTCLYTYSDDEHFIVDHLPGHAKDVVIACGFSGHGFKFVSVIGEILADLAQLGACDLPIDFLRLRRFTTG